MSEEDLQRNQSLEPLYNLTTSLAERIGTSAEQRVDWLMAQTGETFGQLLTDVNATTRGLLPEEHSFDGDGVQAGLVGGSIPPDQKDKTALLDELVQQSQAHAQWRLGEGADAQTVMTELAMAVPTVTNNLHLFGDGNGRTSRILRMMLRDADQFTPDKVDILVNKKDFEKYDTTLVTLVERAVKRAMRTENGTAESYSIQYDVIDDDYPVEDNFKEGVSLGVLFQEQVPGIDSRVVGAYADSFNFGETIRLLAKAKGLSGQISLKAMLQQTITPEGLGNFLQTYRGVRRQRAELLMSGLLGMKELPLPEDDEHDVQTWVNRARQKMGLSLVDPEQIRTARQLQMAYVETFSPQRAEAA